MRLASFISLLAAVFFASAAYAQTASSSIVWLQDEPHVETHVGVDAPEDVKYVDVNVSLFNSEGRHLWNGGGKAPLEPGKPPVVRIKLNSINKEKPDEQYRVMVWANHPALDLTYSETLRFAGNKQPILFHGVRRHGAYPHERVTLAVMMNAINDRTVQSLDLSLSLRDSDENTVFDRIEKLPVVNQRAYYQFDITPAKGSLGPYSLEYRIENDPLNINFNFNDRFAFSNVLLALSSFETDDTVWTVGSYAAIVYDRENPRSGRQSLRIDYVQGKAAQVSSKQVLPGCATAAKLWVKGNGTQDTLHIQWRDHYDSIRPSWNWFTNTANQFVCSLNFDGWQSFRVPVLGDGLQARSPAGSTPAIDAPIYIASVTVHPGPLKKDDPPGARRSVWIDDLCIETQVRSDQYISLELSGDTPDRRLHGKARLFAAVGNGSGKSIKDAKLRVVVKARETDGAVLELSEVLSVKAGAFAVKEFDLAPLHAKSPLGPIDIDVSFVPAAAALRKSERIVFKNSKSFGLFWDFEKPMYYKGLFIYGHVDGKGPTHAQGGAEGSAGAIRLQAEPRVPPPPNPYHWSEPANAVILHPSMPGVVDRIEVMVKGGPLPVLLSPVLVDDGLTGVTPLAHNSFWMPTITVDWQDWRKIELVAPAVPAYYGDRFRYFLDKPFYPLNLGFVAKTVGEESSEVFIDSIRVRTHLPPSEEMIAAVDFPDDTRIHKPGAPLSISLMNFSEKEKKLSIGFQLENSQEQIQEKGEIALSVPPGRKTTQELVRSLAPGIYTLTVHGLREKPIEDTILVLDAAAHFGPEPLKSLVQQQVAISGQRLQVFPPEIRKSLGMTTERIYLDWDNTEGTPGLFHYHWFNASAKIASVDGSYELLPVVGFSADWAGPHAQESIANNTYSRFIGNYLGAPVRMADWSHFVREAAREYKGRFNKWIFWENADLDGGPQSLPPAMYRDMLRVFRKWISIYDPNARIVGGGFNFDKALEYLDGVRDADGKPAAHLLEFDEIAVQMSLGELSPERADIEGFLDDLNELLKAAQTGKKVQTTELDWPIGEYLSPAQQAAYHSRAMLILNSRGAQPHHFSFVNSGQEFDGCGIFWRERYGTSECLQPVFKPFYVPKPAFFSLAFTRKFLESWRFAKAVQMPDANQQASRAFLYTNAAGHVSAAIWRAAGSTRIYKAPAAWRQAAAKDAFGFDVSLNDGLKCIGLPTFVQFPAGYSLEQLAHDLRMMPTADGADPVLLELHVGEPDSARRAAYAAAGTLKPETRYGKLPGGRRLGEVFVDGIESERFEFQMEKPGNAIISRIWCMSGGQKLFVKLNGGGEAAWDLSKGQGEYSGVRESTFVLRGCLAGKNVVEVRYESPGNCAAYRIEPLSDGFVDLARWGVLNAMQTKGELQKFKSAAGTPLMIGKTTYDSGLGSHAVALIEYPLDGQFASFDVTVGVDAVTDGRGSVSFEILVDGAKKADSGVMNGFSKPVTLKVDKLENARRMLLLVKDAEDKNHDDLADWVNGRLFLK